MHYGINTKRNSSYVVVYRYTDDQRNIKQKWESCENFKMAKARKAEIENEIESGTFVIPNVQTVSNFLETFIELYGIKEWSLSIYNRN